jgi:hypothetical protein
VQLDIHAKLQTENEIGVPEGPKLAPCFPQSWPLTCSNPELPLAISLPSLLLLLGLGSAGVAQLVEHLICNQRVGGSIPSASSTRIFVGGVWRSESLQSNVTGWCLSTRVRLVFSVVARKLFSEHRVNVAGVFAGCNSCVPDEFSGRVGEWLKPADCKSAAPCGLRRFESSPVHQALAVRRKPQGNRIKRCSKAVRFAVNAPLGKSAPRRTIFGGNGFGLGSSVGRARPW